ncbi:MAG: hypothetical protein JJE40_09015 [Vicinamibacteria bacterium]|nr:hypothetical protein [Vicinamibacteria bacterium]
MIRRLTIPTGLRDRIAAVIFGTLVVLTALALTWALREAWAVYKLRRGVGARGSSRPTAAAGSAFSVRTFSGSRASYTDARTED